MYGRCINHRSKELVVRKGVRTFVVDPFNKVRFKGGVESVTGNLTNDYTSTYLNLIDSFCRKHDVLGTLVAHPVKIRKDITGVAIFRKYKPKGDCMNICLSYFDIYLRETLT